MSKFVGFISVLLFRQVYFKFTLLNGLRQANSETYELEMVHFFKLLHQIFFMAKLHQEKWADNKSALEFYHLELVVLFALIVKSKNDIVGLTGCSKHSDLVA